MTLKVTDNQHGRIS